MFLLDPSLSLSLRTRRHWILRHYVKFGFGSLFGDHRYGHSKRETDLYLPLHTGPWSSL